MVISVMVVVVSTFWMGMVVVMVVATLGQAGISGQEIAADLCRGESQEEDLKEKWEKGE